jgi:hypothetical protein
MPAIASHLIIAVEKKHFMVIDMCVSNRTRNVDIDERERKAGKAEARDQVSLASRRIRQPCGSERFRQRALRQHSSSESTALVLRVITSTNAPHNHL